MKYEPKISIIMPSYNRCYVVWKAVQSVIAQTYPFWELIFIDDASTDDTELLVKEFNDPRIKYFKNEKNVGPSSSRNIGLQKAKGELIAYLDSDNTWYGEFLQVMNDAFEKNQDKVLAFCKKNYRLTIIEESGEEKRIRDEMSYSKKYFDLKRLWHRRIMIDTNAMMHKRKEIDELGGWDENINFWEDWELTLRISKEYPKGFMFLNRTLLDYEQKLDVKETDKIFKWWAEEEAKVFEKHKGHPLLEGQTWFPPKKGNKSTLGVVEYLREKYKN